MQGYTRHRTLASSDLFQYSDPPRFGQCAGDLSELPCRESSILWRCHSFTVCSNAKHFKHPLPFLP